MPQVKRKGMFRVIGGALAAALPLALWAQDAVRVQPRSYRVMFENDEVRVVQYNSLPGMGVCGTGIHSHPRHLTILLTPARIRVTNGGKTFIATNKEGDVFWSEAERHKAENVSGKGVRSIMVEFKKPRTP